MILFKEDWDKPEYRHVIVDTSAKNESFLRYALLLRKMGVKNIEFCLQLHDASLKGIDPYDPDLDQQTIERIAIECKANFWYMARTIFRDPGASPEAPILFTANRGIMAAYWCFFVGALVLLFMIRQTGKSFGIDWLLTWLGNVRLTKTDISYLTKDEKLRGREVERLKSIELALPPYLKQRTNRDPGNTEVFKIGSLGNAIKLYVPQRSPKLADMVGRGMSAPITVGDELCYLINNAITIPVMLSATLAARELAALKNEPFGNIFMSTTGKRDTPEGKYAYRFMQNCAIFSEKLFDARNKEELRDMVLKAGNGKDFRVNITMNHRQLGKTDDWLRDRIRDSAQEDPVQIRADFLNEWPSGTTYSPLKQEVAKTIRDSEVEPEHTEVTLNNYVIRWYYPEEEIATRLSTVPHIISIDPSEAIGQDAIGIVFRNVYTGEVAGAADITESNIIKFSSWLSKFMIEYTLTLAMIERRSTGVTIIDYLIIYLVEAGIDPFKRVYNQVVQYAAEYPSRFEEIKNPFNKRNDVFNTHRKFFGFATSGSGATSREDLYSRTLSMSAKLTGHLTRDRKLILQILGLEIRNNRVDHAEGEHDDLVIAFLLSFWLMESGRNLSYYGIDPSMVLYYNDIAREISTKKNSEEHRESEKAREDVKRLTEEIKAERDEYMARRLEYDLQNAIAKLSEGDRKILVADDLVNKLREERNRRTSSSPMQDYFSRTLSSINNGGNYGGYGGYGGLRR